MTDVIPAVGTQYTVAELISVLSEMPQHLPVVVSVKMGDDSFMTERAGADVVVDDGTLVLIGGTQRPGDFEDDET